MTKNKLLLIGIIFLFSCNDIEITSPINITDAKKDSLLKPLFIDYLPTEKFSINNTGKSFEIYLTNSLLVIPSQDDYRGRELRLQKITIKSQSEHQVNNKPYPLELQLHHRDSSDKVIVSIFVEEGAENPKFNTIIDNLSKQNFVEVDETFDPYYLFPEKQNFWTYVGCETDDPYVPNVQWFIMKEPITFGKNQIEKIQSIIGVNKIKLVENQNPVTEF